MIGFEKGEKRVTREEFSKIAKGMKAVYSAPTFIADKDALDVWYALLQDLPYDVASMATQKHMMSSNRIPTPADIRAEAVKLSMPDEPNETEAWTLVSKAIRNSSYNSIQEFSKLPPLVQKAVGQPSQLEQWAMDEDYNENVVASNFMRTYRGEVIRAKEYNKLPEKMRTLIGAVNKNSYSAQIARNNIDMIKSSKEDKKLKIGANTNATDACMSEEIMEKLEKAKSKLRI